MKHVHALVDYDNARLSKDRSRRDVASNLILLINNVTEAIVRLIPQCEEINFRFYGGWISLDGQVTHQGTWLMAEIPKNRGRCGRIRVKLSLATSLVSRSDIILIGTYREKSQKMVDGMISVDLMDMSNEMNSHIAIISDDDDFIPSIISSSCRRDKKKPIIVLRRIKNAGESENDKNISACNIILSSY